MLSCSKFAEWVKKQRRILEAASSDNKNEKIIKMISNFH
jgi:thiaminase